ncbi:retinol-binding protein 3 isoform X2 [Poecilia latipinna]|uniref:retinol-binding protein 3 isoform X2 n=1 Tax=Poecilia latipinna TaxID=48699 RepID=UPI00072E8B08|nr:PREDICTED: retinol-binding protein 3 isoform X2 [Poecilia latipinna]
MTNQRTSPLLWILLLSALPVTSSFQPALILEIAKILMQNYCLPEKLFGMQEAIQQVITSGEILQISDKKTLASLLTAGVQGALRDPRLTVSYEANPVPVVPPVLQTLSKDQLRRLVRNSLKLDILENNTGYLRIDQIIDQETVAKAGSQLWDNVWNKVAQTSSLIFDLRYNTGGELSGVPVIISYFSDPEPPIHIDTIYDRSSNTTKELWTMSSIPGKRYGKKKDVIILTSRRTMGAAEAVAYTLKKLKRAIIVGERSAGGSVKVQKIRIAQSDFYITVPVARSINPITGHSWEVSGVSPTINVMAKKAVSKAKSLLALRYAIPKIMQIISDIMRDTYAFSDRVSTLLQHLQSTDLLSVGSEKDLAVRLNQNLQTASEDPRLIIRYMQDDDAGIEQDHELYTIPDNTELLKAYVNRVFKVEVLPGNTGYLRFDELAETSAVPELEKLMAQKIWEPLKDTDNLIIDLRYNTRGSSNSLTLMLSYLCDCSQKPNFFTINDRIKNTTTEHKSLSKTTGPVYNSRHGVYVLASYHTASTGEELAYLIQSLSCGTVVGEITSGNLMHSKTFEIEGTDIAITVPFINFIDNNGEYWLGGGVVPDAIVLAEEALDRVYEVMEFHKGLRTLIAGVGELLEQHYAIEEVAINVSQVLLTKWREGLYRSVVDFESLASQMTIDLQESSGDHRIHVFHCDVEPESPHDIPKMPSPEEFGYIAESLFKTEVLPGNIGYLRFDMMLDIEVVKGVGPQLLNSVWKKMVNTEALIIDMRYNTGGYSTAVPLFCTYFFDAEPPQHLYTIYARATNTLTKVMTFSHIRGQRYGSSKDLFILTSHMTGSPAELFARAMSDLNRATVIGEPTIGGSLSSGTYQIRDSVLYASIPNQIILSPTTGKVWSFLGVEPHVSTQVTEALSVAHRIINLRVQVPSIIEESAILIANNYAFQSVGADVAEKLRELLANGEFSSIVCKESLETKLSADLKTLSGDKSLQTTTNTPALPPMEYSPEMYIELIKISFHTDVFENNIGYLRFDMFGDFEEVKPIAQIIVEHIWNKVVNTNAMIIDLRNNLGGPTTAIAGFCSYFFDGDKEILLDKLYDRSSGTTTELRTLDELTGARYGSKKSLIILTSKATASAAEEFVYIMKKLGRAMIIGETTAGGSHPPKVFPVGESNIFLSIPTVHSETSAGPAWEGVGITPHIPAAAEAALEVAKGILNKHLGGQQ